MIPYKKIHDISQTLVPRADDPGERFRMEIFPIEIGNEHFNGCRFSMNAHFGTHIDGPCHMEPNRKTTDEYPPERMVVPARVVEIKDPRAIEPGELRGIGIRSGEAVLFKTRNSTSGAASDPYYNGEIVYCTAEAMEYLAERKISLVGFDASHGERDAKEGEVQEAPIHTCCFANDILILECIDLKEVPAGEYTLLVLPLKIGGTNGAPARALLLEE